MELTYGNYGLKNVRVNLASVNRQASQKACEVVEVKTNYKRLDDNTIGKEIDFFTIVNSGNRYNIFNVKIPATKAKKVTELADKIQREEEVSIEYQNLRLSLYAMVNNGVLYSGTSGSADDFTIVSTTNPADDEIIL